MFSILGLDFSSMIIFLIFLLLVILGFLYRHLEKRKNILTRNVDDLDWENL